MPGHLLAELKLLLLAGHPGWHNVRKLLVQCRQVDCGRMFSRLSAGVHDQGSRAAEGGVTADPEQHAHPVDMDTDVSPAVLPASQSAGSGRAVTQTVPPENR